MPRRFLAAVCCAGLFCSILCTAAAAENGFAYPAEWESHKSLWMGFRTHDEGLIHEPLLQQLIPILSRHVHLNLMVEDPDLFFEKPVYFSMLGVDPSRITIKVMKPVDFWFRDSGPLFLINGQNQKALADFNFSNYQNTGFKNPSVKARELRQIDRNIARQETFH